MIYCTHNPGAVWVSPKDTAQYYVGLDPAGFSPAYADANCDGNLDIVDALLIAQFYVGLIDDFC